MSQPAQPAYTVLRIKRKATEPPLSSLVIENAPTRRKKLRDVSGLPRARGVFRLAETVPDTWEGRGEEGAGLKQRIERLLTVAPDTGDADGAVTKAPLDPDGPRSPISPQPLVSQYHPHGLPQPPSQPLQPSSPRPIAGSSTHRPPAPPSPRSPGQNGPQLPSAQQYRVVPPPNPRQRNLPPKITTFAEMEAEASRLRFIDAHAVPPDRQEALVPRTRSSGGLPDVDDETADGEMANFQSMLQEYLRFGGPTTAEPRPPGTSLTVHGETEKYVYDLYYRDLRPSLSSTPLGLGVGDGVSIGALLGYEDLSPSSSPAHSEPEDEADEDSNEEDYYRNDYPEDEDADEDMRGYRDAFSEEEEGDRSEEDEGERGPWEYR